MTPIPESEIDTVSALITCKFCQNEEVKTCPRCNSTFCISHSSSFSPAFCKDCFHKLSLVKDKFIKEVSDWNPISEVLTKTTQSCNRLRFDGPDWLFITKWINNLTDDELGVVYEFHYFVLRLIEGANEARKVNRREGLKKVKIPKIVLTSTEKTTKTRKTTKVTDLKSMLRKNNPTWSEAMLDKMMKAMEDE